MAINNDRNLLEQQILSNSGLKGKELENLKTSLATLSEQQLQAELSKSLSGNNKGEWYTGVMLEHNESVIMRNNHDQTTYTDDNGNEISELKDGDEVLERTIKSTDSKGNVFETTVTFSGGKPLTQTKSKNGNTTETTTYKYNDDADVPFVTVETKKADQSKVMTNVLEIDENGNFDNEDFIDRQTTSMDGTTTHIFTENNCVIEQQVKQNGKKINTIYKGDSIEDYDNKKLHRVYQRTELKDEIHEVAYDGNGNTRTVVQNGESPSAIAKKFGVKESSLRRLNPARGKNAITQVGADIVVPGEYNADARVMTRRKSKRGAMQDFANDEVQRTAERLYSSTMQEVTLDKDYKDAYSYARALLAADGVKNPSNQQINNKANEILVANGNIKFKKGTKIQITAKAPDSKFVQDLSNNGFKPTRENAIFYNRFNALNSQQQQNVLSVIKYCRSQKITDPNKIKARILETFPEINLFDSGKLIPMNSSFGTPAFQRKNPVALETFLTETLKLDLKSDVGRQVYERLASLPQEELGKINGSNFEDLSKSDFNDIANRFESSGVNIRTQMENQIELNRRNQQAERLGIPQQKFTSEMLANIYDRAADMMEEYYHNHGVFDAGTYLEGLKNITDWITPDNLFGIDMRSTLHVASDCRKAAQRFRQMHTDNPETFKREYAQLKKEGLVSADYNQQNVQEFMNLIQSCDVDINSDKFKNACKKAFGFKGVENTEKYIQTGQMAGNIGDIAVMLYTLGAASELKMMGKATQGVYGALERGAGRFMSKTAAQKTAKIGTSMAMGGTTLGGFTLGKETLNNLSNPMRDATNWGTWKETGIASAESFGFGAFGGLLNETVVAPIVKAIEKPATKATQAVSKALTEQSELTGKQIMQTVSESGGLKLDGLFKMNSQELANLARTATAKGVGFGAEVTGFTAYEAGLDVIKDLIDPKTGRLPDNIDVKYLCDKFGEQLSNLGTIKGVSMFLMMRKGGKVAQKAMLNEFLSESEALKNIKFKKAEINGHEVYEVTYPNGNRAVVSSPEQAIATCQMAMQMEFLAKSLKEGEPKSEITRPQGMNAEEDALIQKARKENPATIVEEKVRKQWQQHDIETTAPDEKVDLFNLDPNAGLKEPVQNVENEVTSLIFKGKLNKILTQRYDEMGRVFTEIAQRRSADIEELAKQNPKDKQAVADGIVKILAQELGMEGFEPPIVFENTNGGDGFADWPNGRIVINKDITNVKKLTSMISHEFVHMLQYRDVLAQYGEQGLRDLIANDKSIPENEKEQHIKKALNNPYNQHLLQSYDFQKAQTGTVNDYLRRIYKDEFTNTVGTDNMPEYINQAAERGAYSSQEKVDRGLDESNLGELSVGEYVPNDASLAALRAKMKAKLQAGQDVSSNNSLNRTSEHTEDLEINSDGTVTRKGVPAGKKPYTKPEMQTKSIELADDLMADTRNTKTQIAESVNELLSIRRSGEKLFTNEFEIEYLASNGYDKNLLQALVKAKKADNQYAYNKSDIIEVLGLCGNDPQRIFAMNKIIELGKEIKTWDLENYVLNITPDNVDLVFWADSNFGMYFDKQIFKYCKSTKEQLPKLEEIYSRSDLNDYTKQSMAKSYLQAPELAEKLYEDPRFLEDFFTTNEITKLYEEHKDVIDYLISLKNPKNPIYTKYEPNEILDIVNTNLQKSDIKEGFLKQVDELKSLKTQNGESLCENAVELVSLAKNKPELKYLFDMAIKEMTTEQSPCITGKQLKDIIENFDNIPKNYKTRLLKLVNDKNNIFNLYHLWHICTLTSENKYITLSKKSSGDLFKDNPWKIEVFNDILNRIEKNEFTDSNELNSVGELIENILSPNAIEIYNKLAILNTTQNKRFSLKNISELIEKISYYKLEDLDFILNYKDVDGVTPRFKGDEINTDLINWCSKLYRKDFESIAQLKNSDGTYKFDGIAIQTILKYRSRTQHTGVYDKLLSSEINGKAKFNGNKCGDLMKLSISMSENQRKLLLDLMDDQNISPDLLNAIFDNNIQLLPSSNTPWQKLAKSGILTDSEGNIDENLIYNIKLFWDENTTKTKELLNKNLQGLSQNETEYLENLSRGNQNQIDWAKKVIEVSETNNLSQQETRFLWQIGKHSIYDNYHGRWSDLNTEKIDNTSRFLNPLLKSDTKIEINSFNTNEKLSLLNYLNDANIGDFKSNLPFSKFIQSYKSIDDLRGNIIKELEKELKHPGTDVKLTKQQVGALLKGDFRDHLSDYPFINNQSLLKYNEAIDKAINNDNIDLRDLAVLKFSTLLSGLSKDNQQCAIMARNILENNGLTSDITERVFNLIENRNWFDVYKQGKIDIEDIAVLFREPNDFELAKIISEQDFSIGKNKELSSQIEITLEKIYSKAPIVKPTKIPYEQIKFQKIKFNGDDYKVVDFTNSNLDLEALGFPKGIAKEQIRFLTHFMKIANKDNVNARLSASSPELINILCDEVNNTSLSAALIDPLHIDVDVMGRNCAVVLEPMSSNYAAAYHEDFTSPLKKGYSEFKDYLTGKLTPEQREYTSNVYKKYLNLSDNEYIQFYKALSKLDDTSRIKSDIIINKGMPDERTISAIEIVEAIEYVNNSLSNITKNWNELIIYNPKIKALLYKIETPIKNNLLENCPKDLLEFAKKHNLPIFIIN